MASLKRGCQRRISVRRRLPTTRLPDRKLCKHQACSPATSMNRAKQNRISFSCATCCIVREIPAERLPSHISVHYEESQTAREHPAPKALRMALKTRLDFHHHYPKWCPKASDEIVQLCRWPDWPSQSIPPHLHHPKESNRMHGRQYHIQIPGNDSGFQREHDGQSMNAHCQVSNPVHAQPSEEVPSR